MANLGTTFDANTMPQGNGNFDPLPAGWYSATITQAELKDTKSGSGQYIKVRYDITGPTHQGRVVFGNINIRNQNPKAEEIGIMDLGSLIRAIGLSQIADTDQLIGGQLQIKLTVRTQDGYSPTNDVKGYKAIESSKSAMPSQSQAPANNQSSSAAPPWAKK